MIYAQDVEGRQQAFTKFDQEILKEIFSAQIKADHVAPTFNSFDGGGRREVEGHNDVASATFDDCNCKARHFRTKKWFGMQVGVNMKSANPTRGLALRASKCR
jgi:hypothetical protein